MHLVGDAHAAGLLAQQPTNPGSVQLVGCAGIESNGSPPPVWSGPAAWISLACPDHHHSHHRPAIVRLSSLRSSCGTPPPRHLFTAGRNKKLGCNHVFHLHCLRSWLERQQNCPICRRSVVPPTPAAAAPAPAARAAGVPAPPGGAQAGMGAAAPGAPAAAAAAHVPGQGLPAFQPPAAAQQPAAAGAALPAAGWPGAMHPGVAPPPLRRRRGWRFIGGAGAGEAAAQGVAVDAAGWHMVAHYPQVGGWCHC